MFGLASQTAHWGIFWMNPTCNCQDCDHHTYVSKLKDRMTTAFVTASAEGETDCWKEQESICFSRIEIGDRVLVRKVGIQGKHKLADKWESDISTVHSMPDPDIPMFKVKETKGRNFRTLYRKMLLSFNHTPEITSGQVTPDKITRVLSKKRRVTKKTVLSWIRDCYRVFRRWQSCF